MCKLMYFLLLMNMVLSLTEFLKFCSLIVIFVLSIWGLIDGVIFVMIIGVCGIMKEFIVS